MEEIFVTKLRINKVRHLENLEIPLSETERKHLILTGKNGSGKTSVLEAIVSVVNNWSKGVFSEEKIIDATEKFLQRRQALINHNNFREHYERKVGQLISGQRDYIIIPEYNLARDNVQKIAPSMLIFNDSKGFIERLSNNSLLFKIFESKRIFSPKESKGPQKIDLKIKYDVSENANENFVRQLVNLRLDLLEAKDIGKIYEADKIEEWFKSFTNILKEVFEDESLQLVFDRPSFNYNIITEKNDAFNLNQLSDGYSAFLTIVTELIMRMSGTEFTIRPYDTQGLVLIDEIENHLHISLQKKILPFLTSFFPKIQFIVTTHSPFVLSSIDNAVIYDLEKQERIEDLSAYSYTNIVKGYFEADEYSNEIKEKVVHYEHLIDKMQGTTENLSLKEKGEFYELKKYFEELPKSLSPELQLKIRQLELAQLAQ